FGDLVACNGHCPIVDYSRFRKLLWIDEDVPTAKKPMRQEGHLSTEPAVLPEVPASTQDAMPRRVTCGLLLPRNYASAKAFGMPRVRRDARARPRQSEPR